MEPSFVSNPNEWITRYKDTHKCTLIDAIDSIMRKRETKVVSCLECPMAHFGRYNEYTWRCGETEEVLADVTKLHKNCPVHNKEYPVK